MWVAVGLVVVLALILLGGWLIDRNAAKRGLKVNVRHSGLRREVTFSRLDDDQPRPWKGEPPADGQNRGGSR